MTDRARELLERAYQYIPMSSVTSQEIRAYLAEPEVKPLSNTDIYPFCGVVKMPEGWNTFANQETNTNPSETINSQEVDRSGAKQDEEPVAWTNQDELNDLGTDVTCYMYAEPLVGETNIPLYLHPAPRPEFVRLSEEERRSCFTKTNKTEPLSEGWPGLDRFAQAIEDALKEKNRLVEKNRG